MEGSEISPVKGHRGHRDRAALSLISARSQSSKIGQDQRPFGGFIHRYVINLAAKLYAGGNRKQYQPVSDRSHGVAPGGNNALRARRSVLHSVFARVSSSTPVLTPSARRLHNEWEEDAPFLAN